MFPVKRDLPTMHSAKGTTSNAGSETVGGTVPNTFLSISEMRLLFVEFLIWIDLSKQQSGGPHYDRISRGTWYNRAHRAVNFLSVNADAWRVTDVCEGVGEK